MVIMPIIFALCVIFSSNWKLVQTLNRSIYYVYIMSMYTKCNRNRCSRQFSDAIAWGCQRKNKKIQKLDSIPCFDDAYLCFARLGFLSFPVSLYLSSISPWCYKYGSNIPSQIVLIRVHCCRTCKTYFEVIMRLYLLSFTSPYRCVRIAKLLICCTKGSAQIRKHSQPGFIFWSKHNSLFVYSDIFHLKASRRWIPDFNCTQTVMLFTYR